MLLILRGCKTAMMSVQASVKVEEKNTYVWIGLLLLKHYHLK